MDLHISLTNASLLGTEIRKHGFLSREHNSVGKPCTISCTVAGYLYSPSILSVLHLSPVFWRCIHNIYSAWQCYSISSFLHRVRGVWGFLFLDSGLWTRALLTVTKSSWNRRLAQHLWHIIHHSVPCFLTTEPTGQYIRCVLALCSWLCNLDKLYIRCVLALCSWLCNLDKLYIRCVLALCSWLCNLDKLYIRCVLALCSWLCNLDKLYIRCVLALCSWLCNLDKLYIHGTGACVG